MPAKEEHECRLLLWWGGSASAFTRMLGPPERGGRGGYAEQCKQAFEDETKRSGRSYAEVARDLALRDPEVKEDLVHLAGLPPYYQWEDWPQPTWNPALADVLCNCQALADIADGFLLGTVASLEPEAVRDLEEWAGERKVLCLGPQGAISSPEGADPSLHFLTQALEQHGPQSAVYVSFGSAFFPPPEQISILLEMLLELDPPLPFVFTASRRKLGTELLKKIEDSGKGLIVDWAPQQSVLAHPAIGWMISHCGGGGVYESLSRGVPVVGWPFTADQPQHALWLSEVLDTAWELLQVRRGVAQELGAYRCGKVLGTEGAVKLEMRKVLEEMGGEVGRRKRGKAEAVKGVIERAALEGGEGARAMEGLRRLL
ncbi:UDP-Glycosyltransferase/glycogen phosphorylase [Dacryopinax primogenitus]|uniref:UDP-Glycosyltransferase/glycogen phosphorylase n=1 Tax=Dacryopinax primogenitus (strain DJM 731) TaxID=1858805 RepID=M5G757_DACPD|nr:UDP-Glycosyltransferase/glycogen phosphorylase [Dacryopinax primogenitus]EJU04040.1 UDP-Glycosyltransferase/glycogen phosphorylase [Dacryopinax primogenitus]